MAGEGDGRGWEGRKETGMEERASGRETSGGAGVDEMGREGERRTVMHAKADIDGGGDGVGGQGVAEEDGDVEKEVVLLMGCLGCLYVDVCEECLDLYRGCGWYKGVGEEHDGKGVGCRCSRGGDGGVEVEGDVEGVEGGDEEGASDCGHVM